VGAAVPRTGDGEADGAARLGSGEGTGVGVERPRAGDGEAAGAEACAAAEPGLVPAR
jgi:hypothetical protein